MMLRPSLFPMRRSPTIAAWSSRQQALFRSHHYDDYHFLLTLSDYTSKGGLEHHRSSDDRARSGAKMFADADHFMLDASLLPHEYTHSWNGKFMRPAQLWQPDFERPEHGRMLWVYEGLTVYLGDMLTARSGLWSPDTWREVVAYRAAAMAHRTGRDWRPLIDTTVGRAVGATARPMRWSNWRRQTDFYREGQLLWLAVDMKIRALSHDRHSIDDFAQRFFGVDNGSFVTRTYTFDDVVKRAQCGPTVRLGRIPAQLAVRGRLAGAAVVRYRGQRLAARVHR